MAEGEAALENIAAGEPPLKGIFDEAEEEANMFKEAFGHTLKREYWESDEM